MKYSILYYSNGLAILHGDGSVGNFAFAGIFRLHHSLLHSKGLATYHGLPDISNFKVNKAILNEK